MSANLGVDVSYKTSQSTLLTPENCSTLPHSLSYYAHCSMYSVESSLTVHSEVAVIIKRHCCRLLGTEMWDQGAEDLAEGPF